MTPSNPSPTTTANTVPGSMRPARGIVLACWECADPLLHGLDCDPALMPMGDKPALQHCIERLVQLGCRHIDIVLGDDPARLRALIGDGDRWGCAIAWHGSDQARPLQALARIVDASDNTGRTLWWVAPADTLILERADSLIQDGPMALIWRTGGQTGWSGWGILSGEFLRDAAVQVGQRDDLTRMVLERRGLRQAWVDAVVSTASATLAIGAQRRMLGSAPALTGVARKPRADGIWIGAGSRVDPDTHLIAPVFIGDHVLVRGNATIGPNATIGANSIIDRDTSIRDAVIMPRSYVGVGLFVDNSIIAGARLANLRYDVVLDIPDAGLLSGVDGARQRFAPLRRLGAALLWLLSAPLALLPSGAGRKRLRPDGACVIGVARGTSFVAQPVCFAPTTPSDPVASPRAHLRAIFRPGLRDVIAGRIDLIGPTPRGPAELDALPAYWQRLYRGQRCGLLNESVLLGAAAREPELGFAVDAMAAEPQRPGDALRLLRAYFGAVLRDAH